MTGPCASWQCPDCHHVWISALHDANHHRHWKCTCGHDTRHHAEQRQRERDRQRRKHPPNVGNGQHDHHLPDVLLLRARGLTQREVARELGISHMTVHRLEKKGRQEP